MKAMIVGAAGQLGRELQATAPAGWVVVALGRQDLDVTDGRHVHDQIHTHEPRLILNAAAYTGVDAAEAEPSRAFAVNAAGAAHVAQAARAVGARFVHLSTDYVFDGRSSTPYPPDAEPNPLNVYGASKHEGERRVAEILEGQEVVLRSSWVYSRYGRNFVKTMLRLFGERDEVAVVADQLGSPTWGKSLAHAAWTVGAASHLHGIYHWADTGVASWYDFALAIQQEALRLGLLHRTVEIRPVNTSEYPSVARRPPYSVLDSSRSVVDFNMTPGHWRNALPKMLKEMAHG